jgi:hypothetical protein
VDWVLAGRKTRDWLVKTRTKINWLALAYRENVLYRTVAYGGKCTRNTGMYDKFELEKKILVSEKLGQKLTGWHWAGI